MNVNAMKEEVARLVARGATVYSAINGARRLSYPDGVLALEIPGKDADLKNEVARFALECIAKYEYAQS